MGALHRHDRVCVIGAGSSGIAACQVLGARGIDFDCFEVGSGVGGNWRYRNDNGMSAAYESLSINTSRRIMEYASYPMPESYPDYPSHRQIAEYFDAFVDHFGLRDRIVFQTEVVAVRRSDAGQGWDVTVRGVESGKQRTERYAAVMVANGHHWDPRWPEPAFPGSFDGEVIHSHTYDTPEPYAGSNVLVLGIGNSGCDIAVETSRVAGRTFMAMRRGAWIVPKYFGSTPVDEIAPDWISARVPFRLQSAVLSRLIRRAVGHPSDFGLPTPDHRPGEAHPTVSSDVLNRIGHGAIAVKPNIERLEGDSVRFTDGSVERIDKIVYCTGYRINFPFLSDDLLDPTGDNRIDLYRRVVPPDLAGLYFIGLIQPLYAIMPLAELQAEWIADVLQGIVALPDRGAMDEQIGAQRRAMERRYVASKRHTIQVDGAPYKLQLQRERRDCRVEGAGSRLRSEAPGTGEGRRQKETANG